MPKIKSKPGRGRHDSYFALIQRFPLRPIRTEAELDQATDMIHALLDRGRLDAGEQDYLDVLSDLVESFEEEHHPIPAPSDAAMLAYLLELKNVRQSELGTKTGIAHSTISEVLAGKRQLTRGHIEKLAAFFDIEPGVFLGAT
jgi:HTH-type transcriptional regulator/antitoxin HigA